MFRFDGDHGREHCGREGTTVVGTPILRNNQALILAMDASTDRVAQALARLSSRDDRHDGEARFVIDTPGQALRLIHRHEPPLVLVCVGPRCMDASAALIDALHRRRPKLPVVAVVEKHDEAVERALRAAGTSYYFALKTDEPLLRDVIEMMGVGSVAAHSGLSPPRSRLCAKPRAEPPVRARSRYGRSSFD